MDQGMGVNHLGNLLATSPKLADRLVDQKQNYREELLNFYNNVMRGNAHIFPLICNLIHIDSEEFANIIKWANKPFVITAHLLGYEGNRETIKRFGKPLHILGVSESLTDLIKKRMPQQGVGLFLSDYSVENLSSRTQTHQDDIVVFDPNLLYLEDISKLVEYFNTILSLDLDLDFCQEIHSLWFRKILNT
jgi:hypothetical protein